MTRYNIILKYVSVILTVLPFISGCVTVRDEASETQELIPVIATVTPEEEPQPYPVMINEIKIDAPPGRLSAFLPR